MGNHLKKINKRLEARTNSWQDTVKGSASMIKAYRKPGSNKK